jgi:hypothetical protein
MLSDRHLRDWLRAAELDTVVIPQDEAGAGA